MVGVRAGDHPSDSGQASSGLVGDPIVIGAPAPVAPRLAKVSGLGATVGDCRRRTADRQIADSEATRVQRAVDFISAFEWRCRHLDRKVDLPRIQRPMPGAGQSADGGVPDRISRAYTREAYIEFLTVRRRSDQRTGAVGALGETTRFRSSLGIGGAADQCSRDTGGKATNRAGHRSGRPETCRRLGRAPGRRRVRRLAAR